MDKNLGVKESYKNVKRETLKEYEQWWGNNLPNRLEDMKRWFGGEGNENFRRYPRKLIKKRNYKSILDAGAGLCADYYGFQKDYPEISYTGLDITPGLVRIGREKGIKIFEGSVEKMPFPDNSFDCVYIRDTLRHLESYEKALEECLRVSKKEVMAVFCRKLTDDKQNIINYNPGRKLYNNMYSKKQIKEFLIRNKEVKFFYFETINGKHGPDSLLRIFKVVEPSTRLKLYAYNKYRTYIYWNIQFFFKLFANSIKRMIKKFLAF